ncbi:MAG TPA: PhzF family phenazine biosynthesis protein [Burkholderiales bacterium]|nr:PhzF family phenazine biosynthesis protein [Burkholderiales bacterium]
MKLPLYQLDAFTSRRFGGNPAAVVPLDAWLPDETLRAIAAENNLAETAYVIARDDVSPLRWFTPSVEVDLCGHATLATAAALFRYIYPEKDRLAFSTRSGELVVTREGDWLSLDFPSRPGTPVEVTDELAAALGARPREALLSRDLLAVFGTEAEVRALRPDFSRVAAMDVHALIASGPGDDVDFVSRFFAPKQGIAEDPVTGSSHCTLAPYWAARLGRNKLIAKQVSQRGGDLRCELRGERVVIAGQVVEYLRGEIEVER